MGMLVNPYLESAGGAVPVIEGFQKTQLTTNTQALVQAPTGIVAGELLVMMLANDLAHTDLDPFNTPAGWTKLDAFGGLSIGCHVVVYFKIADGTEGATLITWTGYSASESVSWMVRVSGASSPIPTFTHSAATSNIFNVTNVTTTVDNSLVLYMLSFDGGDGDPFSVSGTGWNIEDEGSFGTAGGSSGVWGSKEMPTAGASGTAVITAQVSDGAVWIGFPVSPS